MKKKKTLLLTLLLAGCGLLTTVPSLAQNIWHGWSGSNDYTSQVYRDGWLSVGNYNSTYGPIGTSALEVNCHDDTYWSAFLYNRGGSGKGLRIKGCFYNYALPLLQVEANTAGSDPFAEDNIRFIVLANGNVGIGTATPTQALQIADYYGTTQFSVTSAGFLIARQVDINLDPIPDYVFHAAFDKDSAAKYASNNTYKMMTLHEVENYVKTERHLPGIKSAAEYKKIGKMNVGELQRQLLEKVEELTLYNIQLNNDLSEMKKRMDNIQTQINKKSGHN